MDENITKLLIGLVGVLVGWALKESRDYFSRLHESECSLYLLEGELGTIRSHAAFAVMFRDNAPDTSPEEKEEYIETGRRMIKSLPQISIYQNRFDSIARCLTEEELNIAKNVVTYYNAMRRSVEEARPDLSGVYILETVVSCRRKLMRPSFRLLHSTKSKELTSELDNAIARYNKAFHDEERRQSQTRGK